uniref:Uncharacterized protein n=1 Tax=Arundo donax TaxID=35708 RepID=A0A0A9ARE1_ARUDO
MLFVSPLVHFVLLRCNLYLFSQARHPIK